MSCLGPPNQSTGKNFEGMTSLCYANNNIIDATHRLNKKFEMEKGG